jgi:hypothetical protein
LFVLLEQALLALPLLVLVALAVQAALEEQVVA